MSDWPEVHDDRLSSVLLRVDLSESRFLGEGQYANVVNHLLRSASVACLLDREPEALDLIARAATRMGEWVDAVSEGRLKPTTYADFACARGALALSLARDADGARRTATTFLERTRAAGPGSIQNARLAAALFLGDMPQAHAALGGAERSDPGLGQPWMRFAAAIEANDSAAAVRAATIWLREKMEATFTNEWGSYNEVPIEVSAAFALARLRGLKVSLANNRILTQFRA